jgi:hypothetical protein
MGDGNVENVADGLVEQVRMTSEGFARSREIVDAVDAAIAFLRLKELEVSGAGEQPGVNMGLEWFLFREAYGLPFATTMDNDTLPAGMIQFAEGATGEEIKTLMLEAYNTCMEIEKRRVETAKAVMARIPLIGGALGSLVGRVVEKVTGGEEGFQRRQADATARFDEICRVLRIVPAESTSGDLGPDPDR